MPRPRAFTLIELLVVISIIGLMTAMLLPALAKARRAAQASACLSHLHQLATAQTLYLTDSDDTFWPYFQQEPAGRRWWFGFEPGGPGVGTNRPLDKTKGALGPYLSTTDDAFNCPAFPYDDPQHFPKFDRRAASFGYNLHLTGKRIGAFAGRASDTFVFADGIHFDFGATFNEGHYIQFNPAPFMSGYAHYRHDRGANVQWMDGHATTRAERGLVYRAVAGGDAANLCDTADARRIYARP